MTGFLRSSVVALLFGVIACASAWPTELEAQQTKDVFDDRWFEAAEAGDVPALAALADDVDLLEETDSNGHTALVVASWHGQTEVVEFLLARGASTEAAATPGATALVYALSNRHSDIAQALISHGANVNVKATRAGDATPLVLAAQNGDLAVVIAVIASGAEIDAQTFNGTTALMEAAQKGYRDVVTELIAAGANPDLRRSDGGATALILSAFEGHTEIVGLLLDAGAAPGLRMTSGPLKGRSAADLASNDTVRELLGGPSSADLEAGERLLAAARSGSTEAIAAALAGGAPVDFAKNDGRTALAIATEMGHVAGVPVLVAAGAGLDLARRLDAAPPLAIAAIEGHFEIARLLIEAGAPIDQPRGEGTYIGVAQHPAAQTTVTPSESGAAIEFSRPAEILLEKATRETPLILAAKHGHAGIVELLLENGADPAARTSERWTALDHAAYGGHAGAVAALVAEDTEPEAATDAARTIVLAARGGSIEVMKALLTGARPDPPEGTMPVIPPGSDTANGDHDTAAAGIELKARMKGTVSRDALSRALVAALVDARDEMAALLVEHGADPAHEDRSGNPVLSVAVAKGMKNTARALIAHGADPSEGNRTGIPPLVDAAKSGDAAMASVLLDAGADINVSSARGETALMMAAAEGRRPVFDLLLARGADIDQVSRAGSALMAAAKAGQGDMVDELISRGASVDLPADASSTPLIEAADEGHADIVARLIRAGAALDRRDTFGDTALHEAAGIGNERIVRLLLDAGADPDIRKKRRWNATKRRWRAQTALDIARDRGHDGVVRLIEAHRRAINFDPDGHETVRSVQSALNERGFDAGRVDGKMGPRTRAAIRAFQETVSVEVTGDITLPLVERLMQPLDE